MTILTYDTSTQVVSVKSVGILEQDAGHVWNVYLGGNVAFTFDLHEEGIVELCDADGNSVWRLYTDAAGRLEVQMAEWIRYAMPTAFTFNFLSVDDNDIDKLELSSVVCCEGLSPYEVLELSPDSPERCRVGGVRIMGAPTMILDTGIGLPTRWAVFTPDMGNYWVDGVDVKTDGAFELQPHTAEAEVATDYGTWFLRPTAVDSELRRYALVEWTAQYGKEIEGLASGLQAAVRKRAWFEVTDVVSEVNGTQVDIWCGADGVKAYNTKLTLTLRNLTAYDYAYYSDVLLSSNVLAAIEVGNISNEDEFSACHAYVMPQSRELKYDTSRFYTFSFQVLINSYRNV